MPLSYLAQAVFGWGGGLRLGALPAGGGLRRAASAALSGRHDTVPAAIYPDLSPPGPKVKTKAGLGSTREGPVCEYQQRGRYACPAR